MNRSYIIASVLALSITVWMLAGYLATEPLKKAVTGLQQPAQAPDRMLVEVQPQVAQQVARHIVAQGQVEPNRTVTVRAETAGQIAEVVAEEGRAVQAEIRLEIGNTTVRAPFDGILEARRVELGDYVAVNGEVAMIVDNDPLVVAVQIAQKDVKKITLGEPAGVIFPTGQEGEGVVSFIAPRAEEATRTFRVKIAVPNPDSRIPSGTSAEARLPIGTILAHFISPGLLSLDDEGVLGVKTWPDPNCRPRATSPVSPRSMSPCFRC